MKLTVEQLREALWQAFYHNELDDLAAEVIGRIETGKCGIDGNDAPVLQKVAEAIVRRYE